MDEAGKADFFRDWNDWFWSPDFWLPPGRKWSDIAPGGDVPYPDYYDILWFPFVAALGLLLCRKLTEL